MPGEEIVAVCLQVAQYVQRRHIPQHESAACLAKRYVRPQRGLTIARHTTVNTPKSEKYTMKVGLLNSSSRSSRECVGSGTIPKTAIRTAPPAIQRVLRTIHGENTSPRMRRAKKAFHSSDTAPSGARMTTGSEAI